MKKLLFILLTISVVMFGTMSSNLTNNQSNKFKMVTMSLKDFDDDDLPPYVSY